MQYRHLWLCLKHDFVGKNERPANNIDFIQADETLFLAASHVYDIGQCDSVLQTVFVIFLKRT